MKRIIERISNIYYRIKESRLVDKNEVDHDSIEYFHRLINEALPKTELEQKTYYLIKSMYYSNKNRFKNFVKNTPFEYVILYTDNIGIVNHFNLREKVFISWYAATESYGVSPINAVNNISSVNVVQTINTNNTNNTIDNIATDDTV